MSFVPSKQSTDTAEATGIVFPDGRFIHFCIGQCTEVVRHGDGSFFCRLYAARRHERDEPLVNCRVKRGLMIPRVHAEPKAKGSRYGEMTLREESEEGDDE
jgi:hypothetical protein